MSEILSSNILSLQETLKDLNEIVDMIDHNICNHGSYDLLRSAVYYLKEKPNIVYCAECSRSYRNGTELRCLRQFDSETGTPVVYANDFCSRGKRK
jgi:hypothetical protein